MCDFFSFVEYEGKHYYFDAPTRKTMIKSGEEDFIDSHSVIADRLLKGKVKRGISPSDVCNKFEYTGGKLVVDQINDRSTYDKKKTEKWVKKLVKTKGFEKLCMETLPVNEYAILFISKPCKEVQLEAVKEDVRAIMFISNPCKEAQLEAVKQDGEAIRHISKPCKEAQLEAVKQDVRAIYYISKPCKEVRDYVENNS